MIFQLNIERSIKQMVEVKLEISRCYQEGFACVGAGCVVASSTWKWDYNPFEKWHRRQVFKYESLEQLQRFQNTAVQVFSTDRVFSSESPTKSHNLLQIITYYQDSNSIIFVVPFSSCFLSDSYWQFLFVKIDKISEEDLESSINVYNLLAQVMKH